MGDEEQWEDDGEAEEEDANDWRVAQIVAVALERQASWHQEKRRLRPPPFADDKVEGSESMLSAFADELDHNVGIRDFVNVTYMQTKVSASCLVVAGIYLDRVRLLLRVEDEDEFSSCRLLFLVALMTATEHFDTAKNAAKPCPMATWASAGNISEERLTQLQSLFQTGITGLKFVVTEEQYEAKLSALIQRALASPQKGEGDESVQTLSSSFKKLNAADSIEKLEIVEALQDCPLFQHLPSELIPVICKKPKVWTVKPGDTVAEIGEKMQTPGILVVVYGSLGATNKGGSTRFLEKSACYYEPSVYVHTATSEFTDMLVDLGMGALRDLRLPHAERLVAAEESKLVEIPASQLFDLLSMYPRMMHNSDLLGIESLQTCAANGLEGASQALALLDAVHPLLPTGLLKGVAADDVRTIEGLIQRSKIVTCPVGKYLVRQGQQGDSFFIVTRGLLNCNVNGQTVRQFGPRQIFGEVALVSRFQGKWTERLPEHMHTEWVGVTMGKLSVRTADIMCVEEASVLEITPSEMAQVFETSPQVFNNLFERARGRLLEAVANDSHDARALMQQGHNRTRDLRSAAPGRIRGAASPHPHGAGGVSPHSIKNSSPPDRSSPQSPLVDRRQRGAGFPGSPVASMAAVGRRRFRGAASDSPESRWRERVSGSPPPPRGHSGVGLRSRPRPGGHSDTFDDAHLVGVDEDQ
uniref:Cyclic nucleotide-binding domain-containing protein n=1 Tax=Hemiselmis tepida TaxID=464990 RepID=A0A7S0UZP0_9CRYP